MNFRAFTGLVSLLLCLCYSGIALSGYRTFLDPRSMAMGGTGVASSSKFNASFHNPALIAFNRGSKPDKISISASVGARELYNYDLEDDIRSYQDSGVENTFVNAAKGGTLEETQAAAEDLKQALSDIDLSSYRSDETNSFSLLVDAVPVTINFFNRIDVREMTSVLYKDEGNIQEILDIKADDSANDGILYDTKDRLNSSVDNTYYRINEFGITVATTKVLEYNIPASWGFTPKLFTINGSHISKPIQEYDPNNPPDRRPSVGLLEWNLDLGFAMLLTDDFIQNRLGLGDFWTQGEWIFGLVGMNLFPTDFTTWGPPRKNEEFPNLRHNINALYRIGLANYRENFMVALDLDLSEDEVFGFEGMQRFVSLGTEYYWRDDFHLRAGCRYNTSQQDKAGQDKTTLTGGFLYQPRGFSIEAAMMVNDVEIGGSVGFGLAF